MRGEGDQAVADASTSSGRNRHKISSSPTEKNSARPRDPSVEYSYGATLGKGSFGTVTEAKHRASDQTVAIKKVLQDPRYKNRELDIMLELNQPNIVNLRDHFQIATPDGKVHLHLVMDFVPDTAHRVMRCYSSNSHRLPLILVKLYIYQLCRAIGYMHSIGICHRDVKPQNLLVNRRDHSLYLCDFGSAKRLKETESSVSYICSRFYRAPELMLGSVYYTTAIDVWSIGCVMGELIIGQPLFAGETSVDQLVKIIQNLGTPNASEMKAMNPSYTEFKFPEVKRKRWNDILGGVPQNASDLLSQFLRYDPEKRLKTLDALAHSFFDELRDPETRLPNGNELPELFNFTPEELRAMSDETVKCVLPAKSVIRQTD